MKAWKNLGSQVLPKSVKKFYADQSRLVEDVEEKMHLVGVLPRPADSPRAESKCSNNPAVVGRVTRFSLIANVVIFLVKATLAYLSGSLVIVASALDSLLDLVSGSVLFFTQRAMAAVD